VDPGLTLYRKALESVGPLLTIFVVVVAVIIIDGIIESIRNC
jgi:hypothetical protein